MEAFDPNGKIFLVKSKDFGEKSMLQGAWHFHLICLYSLINFVSKIYITGGGIKFL